MRHLSLTLLNVMLLTTLLALPAAVRGDEKAEPADKEPLTLQAIGKLRLAKTSNEQIIELAKQRGLAFEVDERAAGTLRAMRFSAAQVELLAKIADGRYAIEKKQAEEEARRAEERRAQFEAMKPKAPKPGTAPPGTNIGPRMSDAWHNNVANRVKRIHHASNTNTKFHPAETITVICSEKSAKVHLPDVKKTEQELRKKFDEPIKTGTDKRSAHIVLLDNTYDYENWVKAMFKVYAADGITFTGQDPLAMALKGPAFFTPQMTIVDLSRVIAEHRRHHPVFSVGYLYMEQLMERRSPDALSNGFGNYCERLLFDQPKIRLNSYADREIGGEAKPWAQVVQEQLADDKLPEIDNVLRYSTASMEPHEYCIAWSFTSFLCATPDRFVRMITAIRDKEKPIDAATTAYEMKQADLEKAWKKFIGK